MEEVALEPDLNARVGFFISGDCRKRHSLLGKGKARMLPLLPLPLSQKDCNFFLEMRHFCLPHVPPHPCPAQGLSHSIHNLFTDEKSETQTEVSRLEHKLRLQKSTAWKREALRTREQLRVFT